MTEQTNDSAPQVDPETAAALAQDQDAEKVKEAVGKTRGRPKKATKLKNIHRGPVAIHGHLWKPGETQEVTSDVLKEKRIQNAIKNGILKEA